MFNVVLVHPEIPPNTGNIIRLCANAGAGLHLVHPLGFSMDDKQLRRAGLDYHEYAKVHQHPNWAAFLATESPPPQRMFAMTTRAQRWVHQQTFQAGDWLVFGAETQGLPAALRETFAADHMLKLPMHPGQRSLNLSNAVAVTVYEAWRQQGFAAAVPPGPGNQG
jgi:tRNA (cytidine/uridine-2'-O-)-methyltransferase